MAITRVSTLGTHCVTAQAARRCISTCFFCESSLLRINQRHTTAYGLGYVFLHPSRASAVFQKPPGTGSREAAFESTSHCARIHMPEFPWHTLAALHGLVCCARSPRVSHHDGGSACGSDTSSSLRGGRCDGSSTKLGLALTPDYCCDERQAPEDCCGSQPQSTATVRTIAW